MKDKKIFKLLLNLDYLVTGLIFIILVVLTFLGVIKRYFLNDPFIWLEEVQLMFFVWITYLGAGIAFRTGSHVAIEFIVDKLPMAIRKVTEIIIAIIVLMILGYFMVRGFELLNQLMETNRSTNIFNIPYSLIYSALPIGCILMIINYIIPTILFLKRNKEEA